MKNVTKIHTTGKVNMFQNAQSIAVEQHNLSKLAGLIHKYTEILGLSNTR